MLKKADLKKIKEIAHKYKVKKLFLFGSSIDSDNPKDIDLGIDGYEKGSFFSFYGELFKFLSKPIDLVDMKNNTAFDKLIKETGVKIYG